MFEKLKQFFKKPVPAPAVSKPASAAPPAPAKPAAPAPDKPAATPAKATAAPAPAAAPAARPVASGDGLEIPLKAIMEKMPEALARKVANPSEVVVIPKKLVTQQLPSGAVRIAFGDLRRMAPAGALLAAGDDEQKLVEIPLSEILPKLSQSDFGRRTDQKVIEIPDDVAGIFGPKGEPVTPPKTTVIGVAPVETPGQKPAPAPAAPAPKPPPAPTPAPAVAKAPVPPPVPPAPPPAEPAGPLKVSTDLLQQMAAATSTTAAKPAAPAPAPAAAPVAPAGMVAVPVAAVSGSWPEGIKQEVQALRLSEGSLLVPVEEMGRALKMGKVAFSWKQLLAWTNPALSTKHGDQVVELALKVVAPLFLAVSKPAAPQKKIQVDPSIPDMFLGKGAPAAAAVAPAPAPAPAAAPAVPAPSPAPTPAPVPAPAVAAKPAAAPAAPAVEPAKVVISAKTPAEAVQAAIKLPGVAGAVVASEDGLLVAAQLLPPLTGDKIAAFTPQLFQRTAQFGRDVGAGTLEALFFSFNGATWRVNRCGRMYLAVVGQPQRPLPLTELAQLERELSKI